MILEIISDSDDSIRTKPSFTLRCHSVENYRIHHPLGLCCSDHCHRRLHESADRKKMTAALPISRPVYASSTAYSRAKCGCSLKPLGHMPLLLVLRGALAPRIALHHCVCSYPSSFECNAKCLAIARTFLFCKRSCCSPSFPAGSRASWSAIFDRHASSARQMQRQSGS